MNERILELLVQSGLLINASEHRVSELDPNIKKFAELIVRECMFCCDVVKKIEWLGPTTYEHGVETCKVKIQTHFGVK